MREKERERQRDIERRERKRDKESSCILSKANTSNSQRRSSYVSSTSIHFHSSKLLNVSYGTSAF